MMTRHCHKCGWEYNQAGQPGRGERCDQCDADLRVCLNCSNYDPRAANECRDRMAEPVSDKASGTFCEQFGFARRVYEKKKPNSREAAAREQLKKLFGD